jgi:tetratricopeptide (TPR) repeat protein
MYLNYGNLLYQNLHRFDQAEAAFRRAELLYERLASAHPLVHAYQHSLARSQGSLGMVYLEAKRFEQAREAFEKVLPVQDKLARDYPNRTDYLRDAAVTYWNLGDLVDVEKQPEVKLDFYTKSQRLLAAWHKLDDKSQFARHFLHISYTSRAEVLSKLGRHAKALEEWDQAIQLNYSDEDSLRAGRARALAASGNYAQATKEADVLASKGSLNGGVLYDLARVYSVSASVVQKDAKLPAEEKGQLAGQYATRAVQLLARARTAGFFKNASKAERLKNDTDLAALRPREDFQKLLAELKKAEAPSLPQRPTAPGAVGEAR